MRIINPYKEEYFKKIERNKKRVKRLNKNRKKNNKKNWRLFKEMEEQDDFIKMLSK